MEDRQLQAAVHKAILSVGLKDHAGFVERLSSRIASAAGNEAAVRKAIGDALRKYPVGMRRGVTVLLLTDLVFEATRPILPYLDAASNLRVSINELDSFAAVRRISSGEVRGSVPVQVSEDRIQSAIEEIIGELAHKKDWAGEYADLVSGHLRYRGLRRMVVAALKGPIKKYPLQIKDYGKNGDQIERLFQVDADIYLIQGCGSFAETLVNHIAGLAKRRANEGQWLRYCLIDGTDTARVLLAAHEHTRRKRRSKAR